MSTIAEMRQQMELKLKAMRVICDRAERENREFTAQERIELDGYQDGAKSLKGAIERAERDSAMIETMRGMGLLDAGIGNTAPSMGPWAKAFHGGGRKELLGSGSATVPGFSGIIAPAEGPLQTVLQAIPMEKTDTDGIGFLQETVRFHNAGAVADATLKPTSVYTLRQVSDRVRVVAHLSEQMPRHYFDDFAGLNKYLDTALREGLQQELERLCFEGSGTGEEFAGMLATAGIQAQPWDTDIFTTSRKAITALELINRPGSTWVFNPSDWETIELSQDGENRYYYGGSVPVDRAQRRLWGVPVALSVGLDEGTGLLFNRESLLLYEKGGVRVDWSESFKAVDESQQELGSGFETNQVRFRCESRYYLAVLSPLGIVEVDLTSGS